MVSRSYLILHGLGGSGPGHWQTWLAARLRADSERVAYPDLPDPDLPSLHAELRGRMVLGDKVVDRERIRGVRDAPFDAAAIYQVSGGLIAAVWFFEAVP